MHHCHNSRVSNFAPLFLFVPEAGDDVRIAAAGDAANDAAGDELAGDDAVDDEVFDFGEANDMFSPSATATMRNSCMTD